MGAKRDTVKRAVRKAVKWGGAGLTVLLVVVWIGSGWHSLFRWDGAGHIVMLSEGRFAVIASAYDHKPMYPAWYWRNSQRFHLRLGFKVDDGYRRFPIAIPLWLPALLSLLATAAAWRADLKHIRRARAGLCAGCGYDRAGLAAVAVCPECGAPARGMYSRRNALRVDLKSG